MESSVLNHAHVIEQMHLNAMPFRGCVPVTQNGRGRIAPWMLMSVKEGQRDVIQIYMFVSTLLVLLLVNVGMEEQT